MRLSNPLSNLKPDDRARFRNSLAAFVCVASAALVARTAGDALFLSRFGANLLSYMYVATAAVVIVAAYVLGSLSGRLAAHRLITWACAVLVALLVGLWLLLPAAGDAGPIAAYLMGDLVVNVPMILFWSHTALLFNAREAKRLFGFIGAGGTAGCIVAGHAVPLLSDAFGAGGLLSVTAVLLLGFLVFTRRIAAIQAPRDPSSRAPRRPASQRVQGPAFLKGTWGIPQLRNLLGLVAVASVTLTLVDFQFKAAARGHLPAADLAGFFGSFYGYASVLALLLQLLAVHRILGRGGVFVGLALLPIGLLATGAGTVVSGAFGWTVSMKFVVQVLLFTVDIAAVQMLYLGVPPQSRSQARAFVDGIARPAAMAATGAAMVGLVRIPVAYLMPLAVCVGAAAWLVMARRNHRAYVTALVGSLEQRSFDPSREAASYHDEDFLSHLRGALATASDADIVYLRQIMEEMPHVDWSVEYRALLARESFQVKAFALEYLGRHGRSEDLESVLAHRSHPDSGVRAAAVAAAARLGGHTVIDDIQSALEDGSPAVRAAAVAGLVNAGDLDGLLSAGAVLRDLLGSPDPDARRAAADALGQVENRGLARPLMGLLEDGDPRVVRAALEACRRRADPQLIPALLPLLAQPETAPQAAETLSAFGKAALPHLIPYLQLDKAEGAFDGADRIPDVLADIGDPAALPTLYTRMLDPSDPEVQEASATAYCRLAQSLDAHRPGREEVARAVDVELRQAEDRNAAYRGVLGLPGAEVLADALRHECDSRLHSALRLLELTTRGVDMAAVYAGLRSESDAARANAVEVLDNVLKGDVKSRILAILEPSVRPPGRSDGLPPGVGEILSGGSAEWVTVGAAYASAVNAWQQARPGLVGLLGNPSPAVRETALYALGRLAPDGICAEADLRSVCQPLADDPDPCVRDLARTLLSADPEGRPAS